MIALVRFQVAGYIRSLRVLQPLIVVALVVMLVLAQGPTGPDAADLAVQTFGDVAAFMFPVWAWAARALLDTQPDEQRALTATAARRPSALPWSGLLAAYGMNLALGIVALAVPLLQAVLAGSPAQAVLAGCALNLLVAIPGTLLGAWTSRALIPDPGVSLLALLGGATALLLLGLGRLSCLSVPMIGWMRSAHDGPAAFVSDFPAIALHLLVWSTIVGTAYLVTTLRSH
ncbi:hypothetical protein E1293_46885 [Actinomadura darangshiensis]|uniref:Uncharacterized protein n=1 Tax=Actinomadura darangshiensis TaxID=705336 RepID=A0A4R4ZIS8_9ACTN|nr:hypothetical protein [Actinomadura darangshiensis]TDD58628.1 hypothetical protein E1293_46885 [Actinomadura darangshiensis]